MNPLRIPGAVTQEQESQRTAVKLSSALNSPLAGAINETGEKSGSEREKREKDG